MRQLILCVTLVLLCISVNAFQRNFTTETRRTTAVRREFDPKTFYKPNCEECHGSTAEKRFNPDNPESQMIDAILNGAKAEDTKDMPAFNQKGIDEQKAKILIAYMKSLRE
jgi:mono/diheme cytochrome c family protein